MIAAARSHTLIPAHPPAMGFCLGDLPSLEQSSRLHVGLTVAVPCLCCCSIDLLHRASNLWKQLGQDKVGYGNDKRNKGPFDGLLLNSIAEPRIPSFHRSKTPFKRAIVESVMEQRFQIKWPNFDRIVAQPRSWGALLNLGGWEMGTLIFARRIPFSMLMRV